MDKLEHVILRIITISGNTANRETLELQVQFEDNTVEPVPYSIAYVTEAFKFFCARFIFGRSLSLTRKELVTFTSEQSPDTNATPKQTVQSKMQSDWTVENRIVLKEKRYISLHYWNRANWHIHQEPGILPNTVRNMEPMLICDVVKFTNAHIDINIPQLAYQTKQRTTKFVISLTLPNIMLYTCRLEDITGDQIILDHDALQTCSFKELLHTAAGFINAR